MAQIDAVGSAIAINMIDPGLVNYGFTNSSNSSSFTWGMFLNPAEPAVLSRQWTALSSANDLTVVPSVFTGGTVDGLALQYTTALGVVDALSITDFSGRLEELVDVTAPSNNTETFWEAVMAGDSVVYAPNTAPLVANSSSVFYGDYNVFSSASAVAGNDTFYSGKLDTLTQAFVGDAFGVQTGSKLTGGTDSVFIDCRGDIVGDVQTNLGDVIGGSDRIIAGGWFNGNINGDVSSGSGKLTGGADTITLTDTQGVKLIIGDVGSTGTVASKGGSDQITLNRTTPGSTTVQLVAGDFLEANGAFTGAADTINMTRYTRSFSGGGVEDKVTGDGVRTNHNFVGGADQIAITSGQFNTITGDLDSVTGGAVTNTFTSFTGGSDTLVLTDVSGTITGDLYSGTLAGSYTFGDDSISINNATSGFNGVFNIYGDFFELNPFGNTIAGSDTITFTTAASQVGLVSIYGDGNTMYSGGNVDSGNDDITLNGVMGAYLVGDYANILDAGTYRFGDDRIVGGSGGDTIHGDYAYDDGVGATYVRFGNDYLDGRGGNDFIFANEGNDTLVGGLGNDYLDGGAGSDTAAFNTVAQSVRVDLAGIAGTVNRHAMGQGFDTLIGIENVVGSSLNDTILGSAFGTLTANVLSGGAGNDKIVGRDGNDTLNGDDGNDLLHGDNGSDRLHGGNGDDILYAGIFENDTDFLAGGAGNDTYYVEAINDAVTELAAQGTDTIIASFTYSLAALANVERLTLSGSAAINATGNAAGNGLIGNSGSNVISGGLGKDTLTGGGGNDFFVFNTALNATTNRDTITDFANAVGNNDTIRLENAIFEMLGSANNVALNSAFFKANATGVATDSNDHIIYNTTTGALFYDTNGNTAGGVMQFATITGRPTLTAADFFVI